MSFEELFISRLNDWKLEGIASYVQFHAETKATLSNPRWAACMLKVINTDSNIKDLLKAVNGGPLAGMDSIVSVVCTLAASDYRSLNGLR